jgi:hypothetical protein
MVAAILGRFKPDIENLGLVKESGYRQGLRLYLVRRA